MPRTLQTEILASLKEGEMSRVLGVPLSTSLEELSWSGACVGLATGIAGPATGVPGAGVVAVPYTSKIKLDQ